MLREVFNFRIIPKCNLPQISDWVFNIDLVYHYIK
jgi:hypothetical protein